MQYDVEPNLDFVSTQSRIIRFPKPNYDTNTGPGIIEIRNAIKRLHKDEEYFLQIAEVVKLKSKDESTQIGAVVVGEGNNVLSTGYNSFPRGLDDSLKERQERPEKYSTAWLRASTSICHPGRPSFRSRNAGEAMMASPKAAI